MWGLGVVGFGASLGATIAKVALDMGLQPKPLGLDVDNLDSRGSLITGHWTEVSFLNIGALITTETIWGGSLV